MMKKSTKSSTKRTKSSQNPVEAKAKVAKSRSKSKERDEAKDAEKSSRKTRWGSEAAAAAEKETPVTVTVEGAPQRIRDLVEDKEKLVEYLFLTVTGTALEELIPDYLKKYSVEELKKLCAEQIKDMSKECILSVISGSSSNEKKEDISKPLILKPFPGVPSPSISESASEDVLELSASASEMKSILTDEENQTPTPAEEISDEVLVPESDADLLELEMRARAIRSLLKARTQESPESE